MIVKAKPEDSIDITEIHSESLNRDFLPSLGKGFLIFFYRTILSNNDIIGFVAKENRKNVGFVIGVKKMSDFFQKIIKTHFFVFLPLVFARVIQRPSIIRNILETFLYPKKDIGPDAELVIIAIDKKFQGKGLGYKLITVLEAEFKKRGIHTYKLTVTARNKNANNFYNKLGFKGLTKFNLYQKQWNLLVKNI